MFLSWIPVIGPIIDGLFSYLNKKEDTAVVKYKTDADLDKVKIQSSVAALTALKDDNGLRLQRDMLIWPPVMYNALFFWDYTVALHHPEWVWGVKDIPATSPGAYVMYAAYGLLLGNLYINRK